MTAPYIVSSNDHSLKISVIVLMLSNIPWTIVLFSFLNSNRSIDAIEELTKCLIFYPESYLETNPFLFASFI